MSTRQISFAIQGMYCAKCAVKIETALAQLDGIIAAQVNYASERASVVSDPARVQTAAMIDAVRGVGFDALLERLTLNVRDLIYASSAHTVERVLGRAEGVVDVSADLRTGTVTVTALPGRASRDSFEVLLAWLGFHGATSQTSNPVAGFAVRCLLLIGAAVLLIMGTLNDLGIFAVGTELPFPQMPTPPGTGGAPRDLGAPVWLFALAAFTLVGAGAPFYLRAFAVFVHGEFDPSVLIALVASFAFLGGLVLALIAGGRREVWVWSAWAAFMFATVLTAGWFIARGLALWASPHFPDKALSRNLATLTTPQSQLGVISDGTRH